MASNVSVLRFSPGKLFRCQCPRRVWLEKHTKDPKHPQNDTLLTLGTVVHAVIAQSLKPRNRLVYSQIVSEFEKLWTKASASHHRLNVEELRQFGRVCLLNFYSRYEQGNEIKDVVASEFDVHAIMSKAGSVVCRMSDDNPILYELGGRIDIMQWGQDKITILRDFKLDFKQGSLPRYRLQFGIYSLCMSRYPKGKGIRCEILDLGNGRVIPIEPYPIEKIHRIVLATMERMAADPRGKNTRFCFDCPFDSRCDDLPKDEQCVLALVT